MESRREVATGLHHGALPVATSFESRRAADEAVRGAAPILRLVEGVRLAHWFACPDTEVMVSTNTRLGMQLRKYGHGYGAP